jgi:MYXO-CTERM domain-containing protein
LRPQQKPIALFPELRSEQPAYEWLSAVARAAPMTAAADVALIDAAPNGHDRWQAAGIAPQLRITTNDGSPDDGLLDFGEVNPASPPITKTMTLSDPGTQGIYVDCQMFGSTGDGFTSASTCPNLLMPGDSVDVAITFTPAPSQPGALPDRRISAWRFTELGTLHTVVELTAVVPTYHFILSAYEVGFADTPPYPSAPTMADVVLTNTSLTPIPIPTATISGVGFSVASAPSPGTLAPFATATYRVVFAPQSVGAFGGALHLGDLADVPLHGAGVARAVTAESALDFGDVAIGSSTRRSVTIHNTGATTIAATMLVVSDPQFHVIAPANATIPPGGALAVDLDFTPTSAGSITGRLDIGFDADPQPQLAVALTGVGVAAGGDGGIEGGSGSDTGCCSTSNGGSSSIVLALGVLGLVVRRRPQRGVVARLPVSVGSRPIP